MGVPTLGAVGGYATPAGICVQTSQDNIITEVNKLRALVTPTTGQSSASPDFDEIPPHYAEKLRVEIDALIVAIDAMAVA